MPHDAHEQLRASWESNAEAWTDAVRAQRIPSRRLATDAAILDACARATAGTPRARVLDVGCGEGWLARALAAGGADVVGVDASAPLIDAARAAGGGVRYEVASYDELRDDRTRAAGPFDLVVCNYSLFDDRVDTTLRALRARLAERGRIVVQTVHPWAAAGDGAYEDGWRLETFAAFERPFPTPMPWYFRTLASWVRALDEAGLRVAAVEEPSAPPARLPLSLLLTAEAALRPDA
jgi:2-polyprenyl-3-methyl-5-hydroxy-6-metoxy-1,4-benzoquinol methylase